MEKQALYDEIVGVAFVNIFGMTKLCDTIAISPFDPKNKGHLFVLNVAKGVGGVTHKSVAVDTSKFRLWLLNRGLDADCRFQRITEDQKEGAINPNELLYFMRKWASDLAEVENFDFGLIYDEFYAKKGKKQ